MTKMNNIEKEKRTKGLTPEEFKELWDEKKELRKQWGFNLVSLKGIGNYIKADDYSIIGDDLVLYLNGYKIADLNLNLVKNIL